MPRSPRITRKYTWAISVALPGAVSLSLDPQGEPESFYADGIEYYVINNNQGYDGDLEVALIPESFRRDILMETTDANSVLLENAASETGKLVFGTVRLDLTKILRRGGNG